VFSSRAETRLSEARQFLDAVSDFVRRKGADLGQ